jgi:hypothetical protein
MGQIWYQTSRRIYTSFYGQGNDNHELDTGFFVHKKTLQHLREQSLLVIRCRTRGRWCDNIVLNVHTPTEDKICDMKDSFYEELERIFYNRKIVLGVFNAKGGREHTFKTKTGNESLHEIDNND